MKGKALEGTEYEQLLQYVKPDLPDGKAGKKAFYVTIGDFVSTEDGSGIVHIAPAFGQDDYELSKKYNLPMLQPVTRGGLFTEEVTDFAGKFVKDADNDIIYKLKQEGKLFKKGTIVHSYPFSWRHEDVPVIYYARESWFIRTTSVADRMVELNKTINWQPPEVGAGRVGNWLEENKDWALSRDRFWATPLPIWVNTDGDMICVGSIEELKKGFIEENGKKVSVADLKNLDLHKPFVDRIFFERNGKVYNRTPEVIDVWFDSGSMPFAQFHYPFENKEIFFDDYPADFICEAIDQTRGWFYTMLVISTLLFKKSSYKNVLCLGLINDEYGQKMSKSKGNVVKPWDILAKQGADALRWYFFTVVSPWNAKNFSVKAIDEVIRKFILTLWNTYSFFVIYANIDNFNPDEHKIAVKDRTEIDRWIISELNKTIKNVTELMNNFNVTDSGRLIENFVDVLSNWYVRRSRRRFWKSEEDRDKIKA